MNIAALFEDYNDNVHYLKNLVPAGNVSKYDKTNLHTYDHVPLKKLDAIKCVKDLIFSKKYDLFINLCEDLDDGNRCGQAMVELLHKMNVAYTGAAPKFYGISKIGMKMAAVT
uniref:Uncharacterized protein n=1 Tax=Romanomermis culicivorax TaxID=13658 RepID=A0A915HLL4_ROMCU